MPLKNIHNIGLMRWPETHCIYLFIYRSIYLSINTSRPKLVMLFLVTAGFEVHLLQTSTKESSLILIPRLEAWLCLTDINTAWAPYSRAFEHNGNTSNSHASPQGEAWGDAPPKFHPATDPRWQASLTLRWHACHADNATGASRAGAVWRSLHITYSGI